MGELKFDPLQPKGRKEFSDQILLEKLNLMQVRNKTYFECKNSEYSLDVVNTIVATAAATLAAPEAVAAATAAATFSVATIAATAAAPKHRPTKT